MLTEWDEDALKDCFTRNAFTMVKNATKRPQLYIQEIENLARPQHHMSDLVFSKNAYQGYLASEAMKMAPMLYQDLYFSNELLARVSHIVGKQLKRIPLAAEWKKTHICGRIHRYAVLTDKQGPHYDRCNFRGDVYTVVYTIYGQHGGTQTLRCWKSSEIFPFAKAEGIDLELCTNTMTIHKCSDILHEVIAARPRLPNEQAPPDRYCLILQYSTDTTPYMGDLVVNPVKTALARNFVRSGNVQDITPSIATPLLILILLAVASVLGISYMFKNKR